MERREQIERAANRLRDEWMLTLRELDRRRVETLSVEGVKAALQRHPRAVLAVAGGAVVLVGGGVSWALVRKHRRERHPAQRRMRALSRAWQHPERLATRAPDQPGGQLVVRKVLIASLTTLGVQLATRLMRQAVPAKGLKSV
jgi:hypothetical protein